MGRLDRGNDRRRIDVKCGRRARGCEWPWHHSVVRSIEEEDCEFRPVLNPAEDFEYSGPENG